VEGRLVAIGEQWSCDRAAQGLFQRDGLDSRCGEVSRVFEDEVEGLYEGEQDRLPKVSGYSLPTLTP